MYNKGIFAVRPREFPGSPRTSSFNERNEEFLRLLRKESRDREEALAGLNAIIPRECSEGRGKEVAASLFASGAIFADYCGRIGGVERARMPHPRIAESD